MAKKGNGTITLTRIKDDTKNYAKFRLDKTSKDAVESFGQVYVPLAEAGDAKSITLTFNK